VLKIEDVVPAKRPKVTQRSVVVLDVDRKSEHAEVHPCSAVIGAAKDVDKFEPV